MPDTLSTAGRLFWTVCPKSPRKAYSRIPGIAVRRLTNGRSVALTSSMEVRSWRDVLLLILLAGTGSVLNHPAMWQRIAAGAAAAAAAPAAIDEAPAPCAGAGPAGGVR